jgi:hypothetical protein
MQTLPPLLSPETTHVHVCGQLGSHTGLQSGGVPPAPGTHSCPDGQGGVHTGVVVVVVVVVVCSWQVPPEQLPLQHCVFCLQCFPTGLHLAAAAATPPRPRDDSVSGYGLVPCSRNYVPLRHPANFGETLSRRSASSILTASHLPDRPGIVNLGTQELLGCSPSARFTRSTAGTITSAMPVHARSVTASS